MEIRKMVFDGVSYNVLTDEELKEFVKEVEFKKELDLQHKKFKIWFIKLRLQRKSMRH